MMPMTCARVAAATGGTLVNADAQTLITGVATDSRSVQPGDLFVAISGERVDGHAFAQQALGAGAAAVLAGRSIGLPAIVVDDPVLGLGRLAAAVRAGLTGCQVVGVTGSSGKTSTKDLIAQILECTGPTVAAQGSYNTEVGVPLTILQATEDTRHLVLEMGMRGPGHIAYLCDMARPTLTVLLNVGHAHVGMLGSQEAIAAAKGEILEGVAEGGAVIVNGDDPLVMSQVPRAKALGHRVVTFGQSVDADVRAVDVRVNARACPSFTLHWQDQAVPITLELPGEHMVANALAAAAVGLQSAVPIDVVAAALRSASTRSPMRMELHEGPRGILVVNDAYNANPESMAAALRTVTTMAAGRRVWAVLGEMRELGDHAEPAHRELGRRAAHLGVDHLVCVGPATEPILAGAREVVGWPGTGAVVANAVEAAEALCAAVLPGDVVLVKASRSIGLESVVAALLDIGEVSP